MHDPKLSYFATKAHPYIALLHSPKCITSKCSAKLQLISTKHRPNNEECKTKIHDLQTTNNIENRKVETKDLWLLLSFTMTDCLFLWHFLPVQICATLHPLGHFFIPL